MQILVKVIICFLAGMGAGLGTGFVGLSAAAVISPVLITFLKMPAYEAVGIALASDVLASAVSAHTYGKKHHHTASRSDEAASKPDHTSAKD